MKIINRPQAVVPVEDVIKLLTKFIEKKTGKKVVKVTSSADTFLVDFEEESSDLEEPKSV
jgi:hypothetical protein